MILTTSTENGILLICPQGPRIDATQSLEFKENMRRLVEDGENDICIDFQHVEFIDSSGLGAVVSVGKYIQGSRHLTLTNLHPTVLRVFELTRMDRFFDIQNPEPPHQISA